ncbi:MAG TPA: MMPL family transporter [Candidatus Limnocylindria bacterium]|jgi:RND superfamily putative drug exporter|nr:MMPL family transporter [Candidatus Limnocylindria bacterium]
MFAGWGRFVHRRRWWVLAISALLLVGSGVVVAQGAKLESGGFIETSESGVASRLIERELPRAGGSTFTLVLSSATLSAKSPEFRAAVEAAIAPLRGDSRVATIITPYDGTAPDPSVLFSKDGRAALVDVAVKDEIAKARDYYPELRKLVRSDTLGVQATGVLAINNGFNVVLQEDLRRAETVSLPLALVLLLIVFGSVVAALIPLGVGVLAVVGGIAGMFLLARVTNVSVYALNVVTLIGLGVAIDYSLFIANRFREELRAGRGGEAALAIAMATSGRAIAFSGLTVAIGLTGMLFYQGTFLASMGISGAIVVASAVFYGFTFLPALLAILGRNVERLRIPIFQADPSGQGWWHTIATAVMHRPILVLVPVVAFILLAGSPFLRIRLANGDVTVLPTYEESRAAYDRLTTDFPLGNENHITVVVRYASGDPLATDRVGRLADVARKIAALPEVTKVNSPVSFDPRLGPSDYAAVYAQPRSQLPQPIQALVRQTTGEHIVLFDVVTSRAFYSDEARALVRDLRALAAPPDAEKLVTGFTAIDLDTVEFIIAHIPVAIIYVMAATMLVLFLLLGSVILPIKAVVMNLLSISASFGAIVWIFQDGHLAAQLGFTPASLDPTLPVIMFCTVFGLSMDYEVLLLSRVQEEYQKRRDNTHAVATGLEKSGRLITGAAAIMVGVFGAFALADIVLIKAIGLGMALAVAIDATLVRALVVPATMRLLGDLNWWAPGPLARLQRRLGLSEVPA